VVVIALLLLAGCRSAAPTANLQRFEYQSPHMGTLFSITLYASNAVVASTAAEAAFRRVASLEEVMSDYQADSELMRLCDHPFGQPVRVSEDLLRVLRVSLEYSRLSDGAFDVTIGPCVRLWRFSRKRKSLPTAQEVATAKAAVGWRNLQLNERYRTVTLQAPAMRLDLGGIGKGYAADRALEILAGFGIDRALVAASGDIAIGAAPPGARGWKVGITSIDPARNARVGALVLTHAGVSTSGDTEQFVQIEGVRYSHIVDPVTCLGLTNRIQTTVVGPDATTTDALDTTLSVLGPRRGLALVERIRGAQAVITTIEEGRFVTVQSDKWDRLFVAGP
jgi:thiamine biosynthesis lipoprotein